MFPLLSTEQDNPLELFQLWLNLPEKDKQAEPEYKMLWQEHIPVVHGRDHLGLDYHVKVIAGRFEHTNALPPTSHSWANDANNALNIWMVEWAPHATLEIPAAAAGMTRFVYQYEGVGAHTNGVTMHNKDLLDLDASVALTLVNGVEASRFLFLQGRPIEEEVVQHGPFLASSHDKLNRAIQSHHEDEFGGWSWGRHDPVFPREQGRIAQFDGGKRIELPPSGQ